MDPYLEGEMWQEFHETLAGAIRAQLMPRLAPKYVALLAKRYVLDRSAYVFLSRWQRRPFTQVWPIALGEPLPTVPVPLLPPDPDVPLDLQAAVRACFDLVGYERLLDYSGPPPPPPLSDEDAAWVDERLRASGWRDGGGEEQ